MSIIEGRVSEIIYLRPFNDVSNNLVQTEEFADVARRVYIYIYISYFL